MHRIAERHAMRAPQVVSRVYRALLAQRAGAALFAVALALSLYTPAPAVARALQIVALAALLPELGLGTLVQRAAVTLRAPLGGSAAFFGLLVTAGAFAVDPAVHLPFDTAKLYALSAAGALALLTLALVQLRRPVAIRITWIEVLLAAALAWGFVSNPRWLASADLAWIRATIAFLVLTFVTRQLFSGPADGPDRRRSVAAGDLFNALWIGGVVLAVLGFRQAFDAGTFRYDTGLAKTPMVSTIGIANAYGAFVAAGVIGALATAAGTRSRYQRALLLGAAVLQFAALLGNGSRGALLGLLAAGLLGGWSALAFVRARRDTALRTRRTRRVLATLTAAGVVVILALAVLSLYRLNPASGRGRLMAWEISGRMAADHPVRGIGAGRYGLEYPAYQAALWRDPEHARFAYQAARRTQPHSEPVHLLAERGIPGAVLFVLLWGTALLYLLRGLRAPRARSAADWGLFALIVAIVTHALVDTALHWIPTALAAHLALGLVPAPALRTIPGSRGAARVLAAIALAYVTLTAVRTVREYPGYGLWRLGQHASGAAAVTALEAARARLDAEERLDLRLGVALLDAGRPREAAHHLEAALTRVDDLEIRLELARAYLELGWIERAEHHAKEALASFPDRLRPQLLLARIHIAAGRHEAARAALTRCILRLTHYGTSSVDDVVAEAHEIWRAHYDDEPPR